MSNTVRFRWKAFPVQLIVQPTLGGATGLRLGRMNGVTLTGDFPGIGDDHAFTAQEVNGAPTLIALDAIGMVATLQAPDDRFEKMVSAASAKKGDVALAKHLFDQASAAAEEILDSFVDYVAVIQGHPHAGVGKRPKEWPAQLIPGRKRKPLTIAFRAITVVFPSLPLAGGLATTTVRRIARSITAGELPPLGWRIYRRAVLLSTRMGQETNAIVEATTAVEVAVEETLRSRELGLAPVLQHISVNSQLTALSNVIFGQGFDAANPTAYDGIRTLISDRNGIVHEGKTLTLGHKKMRQRLEDVRLLLEWLDAQL